MDFAVISVLARCFLVFVLTVGAEGGRGVLGVDNLVDGGHCE